MDDEGGAADAPDVDERHLSCSMTSIAVSIVRSECGEDGVGGLLRLARSTRSAEFLETVENWVSLDEACALLEAGVTLTGDRGFARRVGESTLRKHAGTAVATMLRSLGSVESVMQAVTQTTGKLSSVTDLEALEVEPGRAVVRARARTGFERRSLHCDYTAGMLSGTPQLFGLPPANVTESECQAQGGRYCLYTVEWDARRAAEAADPQLRVTALEAQLLAMNERLRSVYSIASDLVVAEDVDAVLHRIVAGAADAVRAPCHILAVRPHADGELKLYTRGIAEQDARVLVRGSLDGTASGSAVTVDVSSPRRSYGHLIAGYPGGAELFPQDEEVLFLYAKHAAAVLDLTLALRDSAHRHEQVSSLLALSHAIAEAGTSVEVAERLAAAVPAVVDCDRMGVWLWHPDERWLSQRASWRRPTDPGEDISGAVIRPEDTENLRTIMTDPQPLYFETGTDDEFVGELMQRLMVVALTVVPIVARGAFLGILTVSVTHRPERLRLDPELLERLTGVAALAAPAIQNGQLIDQLGHRASHDGLTGLLNRVGFRQHIDDVLAGERTHDGRVGLLFVDLNDFKSVNDLHGHEAGDELLRQVAARLDASCRGADVVARLGGDEFAIVLADARLEHQVRSAEKRIRGAFEKPFTVGGVRLEVGASVGGGVWPDDGETVDDLVRRADAAMYSDKARSRDGREGAVG